MALAADACASCHPAIAASYARTGMGQSFRAVKLPLPEFQGQVFAHAASEQFFVPFLQGGRPHLRRYQKGPDGSNINVFEKQASHIIGSGNHAQTYLHRTPAGKLIELPLTWYSEKGGYWHMSPAYDRPDHAGFSRQISYRCMFCHNAYPEVPPRADEWDGAVYSGALPEGIDCQRCHGPGREHIEAAQQRRGSSHIRTAIVNPARLSRERQLEVCMQCHLETTSSHLPAARLRDGRAVFSYRPGEPLGDYVVHFDHAPGTGHDDKFEIVNAAYGVRKSACFANSATLTCTTCHDPHGVQRDFSRTCRTCHTSPRAAAHTTVTECVSCHMPKRRPSDVIHVEMTDHQIRRIPSTAPSPQVEENTANTPPYRGQVVAYYPSPLFGSPQDQLDLALAQVEDGSNLKEGIVALERLLAQHHPVGRHATFFELGQAQFRNGDPLGALPHFDEALRRSPGNWRYLYAAALAASAARRPDLALQYLARARSRAPGEAIVLVALADLQSARGFLSEAAPLLRWAIDLEPELAEGHNNLGVALMQAGDLAGARRALAEAVRLRPEMAEFQVNIATLFTRLRDLPMARFHLEHAVRTGFGLDQANRAQRLADMRTNLGAVLSMMGDHAAAVREYRTAITEQPRSGVAHLSLGFALADLKDLRGAEESLRKALALSPAMEEGRLKLGEILLVQGRREEAREELTKAVQSPDQKVSAAARALLDRIAVRQP